jgi:C_GCAxxG_C_C family probable redox protein
VLDLDISPDAAKMFSGYGGGLGQAGCMCGALSASVGVLGFFKGRKSTEDDRSVIYKLSRSFHDRFEEEFGATCCRVLNPNLFGSKDQRKGCLDISVNTSALLMRFLQDEDLLSN